MTDTLEVGALNVSLTETLDISTVQNLHADLKAALDSGAPVALQGAEVERVDAAALQVLVAMFMYASSHQCRIELKSPSEALVQGAALLGVDGRIGLKAGKIS